MNIQIGDIHVILESVNDGNFYKVLSVRSDGHFSIANIKRDNLERLYICVGSTNYLYELIRQAKKSKDRELKGVF